MNPHSDQRRPAVLTPREHGAYGQLFAPLTAALFGRGPSLSGVLLAGAATCAFFAHEPWLVMIGQRGTRAERTLGTLAKRRLALLLGATAVLGILGLVLSDRATRAAALFVALLALITGALSHYRKLHTAMGEVWAGTVLAMLGLPVSLACGARLEWALANALAWALAFAGGVYAVRSLIERQKTGKRGRGFWGMLAVVLVLSAQSLWSVGSVLAVLPLTLAAIVVFAFSPSPKKLRKVGWSLVACTVAASMGMVFISRARTSMSPSEASSETRTLIGLTGPCHQPS